MFCSHPCHLQEVTKLASDIKDAGLSLIIFGEWYHVESMNQVGHSIMSQPTGQPVSQLIRVAESGSWHQFGLLMLLKLVGHPAVKAAFGGSSVSRLPPQSRASFR